MQHVLAISIGPVQDFIAAARKTRDLWFGSEMLCEVSRAVASSLKGSSAELVFPPDSCLSPGHSVANKIVVILPEAPTPDLIADAKKAGLSVLQNYKAEAITRLNGLSTSVRVDLMGRQLDQFLEFYAAWWPMKSESDYSDARKQADLLLAGRKALRDFAPACGLDGVPKSSLDGGRETVLTDPAKWSGETAGRFLKLGIKSTEQLDGISLIKRIADLKRFVSVARVAVDPLIRRLSPSVLGDLCQKANSLSRSDLVQSFKKGEFPHYDAFPYDTQLFYNDGKGEASADPHVIEEAKAFHDKVSDACKDLDDPPAYFAVIAGDGDNVGAAIGRIDSITGHVTFSETLGQFAAEAKDAVNRNCGALVYSGGDDVLAFLPLDKALQCASELRQAFESIVGPCVPADARPSFSCGVSIAHYGEHLQNLVQWARDAEHAAKSAGRNRLAVHLHTRTAGEAFVGAIHEWTREPVTSRWENWIRLYLDKALPHGAVFDLRTLARELRGVDLSRYPDLMKNEVTRVLSRKRKEQGKERIDEALLKQLVEEAGQGLDSLDNLVNELVIARRIASVRRLVADDKGGAKGE